MAQQEFVLALEIRPVIGYPLILAAMLFDWWPWLQGKMINAALRIA